jgi:hypothetical protein
MIQTQTNEKMSFIAHYFTIDHFDFMLPAGFSIAEFRQNEWEQSDAGKWLIKHSNPPIRWEREQNSLTYQTTYAIVASLTNELYTFWKLKYD